MIYKAPKSQKESAFGRILRDKLPYLFAELLLFLYTLRTVNLDGRMHVIRNALRHSHN